MNPDAMKTLFVVSIRIYNLKAVGGCSSWKLWIYMELAYRNLWEANEMGNAQRDKNTSFWPKHRSLRDEEPLRVIVGWSKESSFFNVNLEA